MGACADEKVTKTASTNKADFATAIKDKMPIPQYNDETIAKAEAFALAPDQDFQVNLPQKIDTNKILQKYPNRFDNQGKISDAFNENDQYIPNKQQQQSLEATRNRLIASLANQKDKNTANLLTQQLQSGAVLGQNIAIKNDLREEYEIANPNEGLKSPFDVIKKDPNQIYSPTDSLNRPDTSDPYAFGNNAKALGASILLGGNIGAINKNSVPLLNQTPKTETSALKYNPNPIALLVPLTGPRSSLGKDFQDSALLALQQFAQNSGQKNISKIIPIDTKGTEAGAMEAMKFALDNNAKIIIGPLFANEARAVAPMVQNKPVMVISFSNSTFVAQPNIFPIGYYPEAQIETIMNKLVAQNAQKLALMAPDNEYGRLIAQLAQKYANEKQIKFLKPLMYDENATEFGQLIAQYTKYYERKAKSIGGQRAYRPDYDAMIIAENNIPKAQNIINQLQVLDAAKPFAQIYGLQVLDDFQKIAQEPAAKGLQLVSINQETKIQFETLFAQSFKRKADRRASLGFDAASLAIFINGNDGNPLSFIRKNTSGFVGVDGRMQFNPNGIVSREYNLYELTGDGAVLVR